MAKIETHQIAQKLKEKIAHADLTDMPDVSGTVSDHDARYYTETECDALFAVIAHTHDDRYYTETECDNTFAIIAHTHDGRYYTETEINVFLAPVNSHPHQDVQTSASPEFNGLTSTGQIALNSVGANYLTAINVGGDLRLGAGGGTNDLKIDTNGDIDIFENLDVGGNLTTTGTISGATILGANVTSGVDPGHSHTAVASHTIVSHSDTTATGAELNELTDGSETTLHSHAGGACFWARAGTTLYPATANDSIDIRSATGGKARLSRIDATISNGEVIGAYEFYGTGGENVVCAKIEAVADQVAQWGFFGVFHAPTKIDFYSTDLTEVGASVKMSISSYNRLYVYINLFLFQIKSGATQGAAGALINEVWKTSGHATLPDNVVMIGV